MFGAQTGHSRASLRELVVIVRRPLVRDRRRTSVARTALPMGTAIRAFQQVVAETCTHQPRGTVQIIACSSSGRTCNNMHMAHRLSRCARVHEPDQGRLRRPACVAATRSYFMPRTGGIVHTIANAVNDRRDMPQLGTAGSSMHTLQRSVCDATLLQQAVQEARRAGTVVLDCEGQDLGSSGAGVLSIVQLLPLTTTPTSYIIDVLAFDKDSLQPLLRLLSDGAVSKVMFDCRNDASALWHEWGCRLKGVVDLQLLDVLVHARTSEEWQKRGWLRRYLKATAAVVKKQRHLYKHVWPISGLNGSVKKHNVVLNAQLSEHLSKKQQLAPGWSAAWLERPLASELVDYAVADVLTIMELYSHFNMKGHLAAYKREVCDGSDAYAAFYVKQQHERDNPYCNHAILPMNILMSLSAPAVNNKTGQPYPQRMCSLCRRELPSTCFYQQDNFCYVCGCVAQRLAQQ